MKFMLQNSIALLILWNVSSWWPLPGLLFWYPICKSSLCNTFEEQVPIDFIYGYLIIKWVADSSDMTGSQHNSPNGCLARRHVPFSKSNKKILAFTNIQQLVPSSFAAVTATVAAAVAGTSGFGGGVPPDPPRGAPSPGNPSPDLRFKKDFGPECTSQTPAWTIWNGKQKFNSTDWLIHQTIYWSINLIWCLIPEIMLQ